MILLNLDPSNAVVTGYGPNDTVICLCDATIGAFEISLPEIVNGSTGSRVTGIIYYNVTGYTDIQPYRYLKFIYYTGVGWVHPQL